MICTVKTDLYEINILKSIKPHYKLHTHSNICICALKNGTIEFFNDGKSVSLSKNQLIVFNANSPHKIKSYKNVENYYILHLYIENILLQDYIKDRQEYENFISFCEKSVEIKDIKYLENFIQKYRISKDSFEVKQSIKNAKQILDKNIDTNISLSELAKSVNLNESYLSRSFKKHYGLSPRNYVLNQRVSKAKELLDSGLKISEVALELGFYDQAHFYKIFKSIYSITPLKYIKINQKQT